MPPCSGWAGRLHAQSRQRILTGRLGCIHAQRPMLDEVIEQNSNAMSFAAFHRLFHKERSFLHVFGQIQVVDRNKFVT
eukprot:scaffold438018_cov20-Prasinocladus_malaysianus.AAC.1